MISNKKKILAVILARGGSKGIKLKNIIDLAGNPLISYTIEAAKKSKYIDNIIVSTDSRKIAKVASDFGAEIPFFRNKKLSGDKVISVDALYDAVVRYQNIKNTFFDYIIELPCVSPLRGHKHIDEAIKLLDKSFKDNIDSVTAYVNTGEKHPTRLKRIKNNLITDFCKEYPEKNNISRRQDFEPCYIRNGSIYAMTNNCLVKHKSRHGKKMLPYIMSSISSINIDEKSDLVLAESLIKNGYSVNFPKKIFRSEIFYSKQKNKIKLLITTDLDFVPLIRKKLENEFECVFIKNETNINTIKNEIKKVDGWICSPCPNYKIDESLIPDTNKLKFILTPSTGVSHIDVKFFEERGIIVKSLKNTKLINKISASSEFTFLMLLNSFKNFVKGVSSVKVGYWRENERKLRGNEIFDKTLGIVGFGRIGSNVAKYALSMGMKILVFDPYVKTKNPKIFQFNNLYQMLRKCDAVIVSVHLDKKTKNLIDKKFLNNLKNGSILINSSRGEILDDKELIKFLRKNSKSKAIIDVIKDEQKKMLKGNLLYKFSKKNERLLITPHMAGLTYESESKAAIQTYDSLTKIIRGINFE